MKTVFLDRDGTIIVDKVYLNDPNKIEFLPNAMEGMKLMTDIGYQIFVVTNQSGIPRGKVQIENLHKIHRIISFECAKRGIFIKNFYYAPYMTESNHFARKPNPGMLHYADWEYSVDFKKSWIIGDRLSDVEAGHRAGCKGILIESHIEDQEDVKPEYKAKDLLDAANFIRKSSY